VKTENPTTKTFTLKDRLCAKAKPGQFLMLWIPRVDEIPLSIMNVEDNKVSVTVKAVGEATKTLHKLKSGEIVGLRGPFGNSFTENHGRILMVGGGTGTAPLLFLAKKLSSKAKRLALVIGAKTKSELLFPEPMIREVFDLAEKRGIALEASLERLMRCGIGLCGSCVIGKYRVCRDGPVFNAAQLREVKDELGISKLGFDGNRIPL